MTVDSVQFGKMIHTLDHPNHLASHRNCRFLRTGVHYCVTPMIIKGALLFDNLNFDARPIVGRASDHHERSRE